MTPETDHSIYISHAWGGVSEEVVQEIYNRCRKTGLNIIMDRQDLGYRESITSFMENLGQADAIILVVSNKYLHSEYCMFELLQIYENKNMIQRIFPIVLDEVSIAKSAERLELVRYWENETDHLESKIRELKNLSYIEGITDDLNLYQKIRNNIANLTRILKDINTLNIRLHKENDYNDLIFAIESYLEKSHLEDQAEGVPSSGVRSAQQLHETAAARESENLTSKKWWTKIFRILPYVVISLLLSVGVYRWFVQRENGKPDPEGISSEQKVLRSRDNRVELSALNPDRQVPDTDPDNQSVNSRSFVDQSHEIAQADKNIVPPSASRPDSKLHKLTGKESENINLDSGAIKSTQPGESGSSGEKQLSKNLDETSANVFLNKQRHISGSENTLPDVKLHKESVDSRIENLYLPESLITVRFTHDISSNMVEEGELVYLTAEKPIWSGKHMVTEQNARVRAKIIDAKASQQGGRGSLGIRIEAIETLDGQWLELNYHDILEKRRGEIVFSKGSVLENVKLEPITINLKILN